MLRSLSIKIQVSNHIAYLSLCFMRYSYLHGSRSKATQSIKLLQLKINKHSVSPIRILVIVVHTTWQEYEITFPAQRNGTILEYSSTNRFLLLHSNDWCGVDKFDETQDAVSNTDEIQDTIRPNSKSHLTVQHFNKK